MRNRGRFQAQGNGLEKSEPWAKDDDVTKVNGRDLLDDLQGQLTVVELNERNVALQKARRLVDSAPALGIPGQVKKSFFNNIQHREIRIDVEINGGFAFTTPND